MKIRNTFFRDCFAFLFFLLFLAVGIGILVLISYGFKISFYGTAGTIFMLIGIVIACAAVFFTYRLEKKLTPKTYEELSTSFSNRHSDDSEEEESKIVYCADCRGNYGHWVRKGKKLFFEECSSCKGLGEIIGSQEEPNGDKYISCTSCAGDGWIYTEGDDNQKAVCQDCGGCGFVEDLRTDEEKANDKKAEEDFWVRRKFYKLTLDDDNDFYGDDSAKRIRELENKIVNLENKLNKIDGDGILNLVKQVSKDIGIIMLVGIIFIIYQCSCDRDIEKGVKSIEKEVETIDHTIRNLDDKVESLDKSIDRVYDKINGNNYKYKW